MMLSLVRNSLVVSAVVVTACSSNTHLEPDLRDTQQADRKSDHPADRELAVAGNVIIRVQGLSEEDLEFVLAKSTHLLSERISLRQLDVLIDRSLLQLLDARKISYRVLDSAVEDTVEMERQRLRQNKVGQGFFEDYQRLASIREKLQNLERLGAEVVEIGSSIEGRPIEAIWLSGRVPSQPVLMITCGVHAREWISHMTCMYIADRLLNDKILDPVLERIGVVIVPVSNPDGYEYTWNSDRYWRKNRRVTSTRDNLVGVDLNRNFAGGWGGPGSSDHPSSDIYRGESEFSEPESQALRDLFTEHNVVGHIDFHSYSQLVLYPWGVEHPAPHREALHTLSTSISDSIEAVEGQEYTVLQSYELYPTTGTTDDWTYSQGAHSVTIELRPKSSPGFVLPPEEIVPTGEEGLAATLAFMAWLDEEGIAQHQPIAHPLENP